MNLAPIAVQATVPNFLVYFQMPLVDHFHRALMLTTEPELEIVRSLTVNNFKRKTLNRSGPRHRNKSTINEPVLELCLEMVVQHID